MFVIKPATEADLPLVLSFIRELAAYEKLSHLVVATEADLHLHLFGEEKAAEVLIGYEGSEPAAFALFFRNFSTFLGKPGIYLEDLFVKPSFRRKGYGKALLKALARLVVERHFGRLEWSVLDWNKPAIDFYREMGAVPLDDWTMFRLSGADLLQAAQP
jgi:GNAT superfamily N-acetyltransferase